jgi:predicted MFS family arabinose efflux permease
MSDSSLPQIVVPFPEKGLTEPTRRKTTSGSLNFFLHLKLIGGALFLLAITLGFSGWLALISLDDFHTRSSLRMVAPIALELKHSIETNLNYGRYIEEQDDIEWKIKNAEQVLNYALNSKSGQIGDRYQSCVFVVGANYELLYGTKSLFANDIFEPDILQDGNDSITLANGIRVIENTHHYHLMVPLYRDRTHVIAYIVLQVESGLFKNAAEHFKISTTRAVIILSILSSLILITLIPRLLKNRQIISDNLKRRISITIFVVIFITQAAFFTYSISQVYIDSYHIYREKAKIILMILSDKFDQYIRAEIDLSMIADLDSVFNEVHRKYPEITSISYIPITKTKADLIKGNKPDHIRHSSFFKTDNLLGQPFQLFSISYMLFDEENKCNGILHGKLNNTYIIKDGKEFVLDILTVLVVSILLIVELLILFSKMIESTKTSRWKPGPIHFSLMRPAAFMFLFGIDISMSFLPLHAEKLYSSFWGLSKDTVMGLPISVEFFCVGIAILISGFWNDRRGWHEPFLTGIFLAATGGIYSWIAPDVLNFIISRALVGIGYGLMLLAAQGFVITYTDETNRTQGLAQFLAGLYAGSICGGATGALLAEHFGYRSVFLFGAIILYGVMFYIFIFLRNAMVKPATIGISTKTTTIAIPKWKPFFKNRTVIALIFFSSLPAAIAVVGFLNYFSPIYLNSIGASQATIGRVLMIYGVSLIYIGPMISRHVDASCNKKQYIFIGCLLGATTFLIFNFFNGIYAAILAVFILGLSSSFVIASQGAYLLNLNVTQHLGAGKAIGVFRATSRVGQALGPLIFSFLTISTDFTKSITQLGLFYLLTAFLFLLMTYRDKAELKRS